jgi:hypothetical protein
VHAYSSAALCVSLGLVRHPGLFGSVRLRVLKGSGVRLAAGSQLPPGRPRHRRACHGHGRSSSSSSCLVERRAICPGTIDGQYDEHRHEQGQDHQPDGHLSTRSVMGVPLAGWSGRCRGS